MTENTLRKGSPKIIKNVKFIVVYFKGGEGGGLQDRGDGSFFSNTLLTLGKISHKFVMSVCVSVFLSFSMHFF